MLHKVIIRNFKSLRDVELDLQKVNLLIGTNNSGKSNFLKALKYFSTEKNSNISGDIHFKSIENNYDNSLLFLNIEKDDFGYFHYFINDNGGYFGYIDNEIKKPQIKLFADTKKNSINTKKYKSFTKTFKNLKIYKPDPNKLSSFSFPGEEEYLEEDASNLVSFIENMILGKPEVIDAIVKDLKVCISNFEGIRLRKEKGNPTKKQIGLIDINKNIFWADELSEGVLYFLAILAILHQPNPPKILLLEEPERNVHPRRIKEIIDFIFKLSDEKDIQIIMTTHSMLVVDEFQDIPDAVFVFDMVNSETEIKNLKTDIIDVSTKKSKEKGFPLIDYKQSLGDKWFTGFLGGVPMP